MSWLPQRIAFLRKTINIIFMSLVTSFTDPDLKKSLEPIQSYNHVPFWTENGAFAPKKIFFWKTMNIIFMYLFASFIVQNFKNIRMNTDLWWYIISGNKIIQLPLMRFFWKIIKVSENTCNDHHLTQIVWKTCFYNIFFISLYK